MGNKNVFAFSVQTLFSQHGFEASSFTKAYVYNALQITCKGLSFLTIHHNCWFSPHIVSEQILGCLKYVEANP